MAAPATYRVKQQTILYTQPRILVGRVPSGSSPCVVAARAGDWAQILGQWRAALTGASPAAGWVRWSTLSAPAGHGSITPNSAGGTPGGRFGSATVTGSSSALVTSGTEIYQLPWAEIAHVRTGVTLAATSGGSGRAPAGWVAVATADRKIGWVESSTVELAPASQPGGVFGPG